MQGLRDVNPAATRTPSGGSGLRGGGDVAFDQPDLADVRERQVLRTGRRGLALGALSTLLVGLIGLGALVASGTV